MTRLELRTLVLTAWRDRNLARRLDPADRPLGLTLNAGDYDDVLLEHLPTYDPTELAVRPDGVWLWRGVPLLSSTSQPAGEVLIQWPA